ncbi:unnamed protein product [Peronospora belbahrii]|uniref:Uncharacterized protein n=1 Tax=Peronospora belbahrii TaxID=622444 RepID=A0ABN8CYW6_9STRA|nr:unnamed protein product [Peronospora belbahrii]
MLKEFWPWRRRRVNRKLVEARHSLKFRISNYPRADRCWRREPKSTCGVCAKLKCSLSLFETQLLPAAKIAGNLWAHLSLLLISSTLKISHGRTDDEIIVKGVSREPLALASTRDWRDDVDFVPQLQTVLGAMNDVLQLCQTHATALPASYPSNFNIRTTHNEFTVTVKYVQSFRKRVLDALALGMSVMLTTMTIVR